MTEERIQLTKNFYLNECAVSSDHPILADQALKELLDSTELQNRLKLLFESVIQPVRNVFALQPMYITSGYRPEKLNSSVGGGKDSDHLYAMAADIKTESFLEKFLWAYHNRIPYRQMIIYPDMEMIHFSVNIPGRTFKNEAWVRYSTIDAMFPYTGGPLPEKPKVIGG